MHVLNGPTFHSTGFHDNLILQNKSEVHDLITPSLNVILVKKSVHSTYLSGP